MKKFWLVAVLVAFAPMQLACGQSSPPDRIVRAAPGQIVRVGVYTDIRPDCISGPLPAIRLARAPAHGAVSVKRGMLKATNVKQCLAIDVPAFVAFYRAVAGFSGADEFELEITFASGHKQIQRFQVSVAGAGNGGKGSGQGI
ncbi:MAG: hypothetical protein WBD71_09810 [Xanthobacteraceae bacterium]